MPTLAEQRAAISAGVNRTRAATGADERRATGKRIEAERRGTSVVEDINRLITPVRQRRTLRSVAPVGAVPVTRGRGNYVPPPPQGGGGMASPLTEQDYAARAFHAPRYLETSDGLFTLELLPPAKIVMTDADGVNHDFNYAAPP